MLLTGSSKFSAIKNNTQIREVTCDQYRISALVPNVRCLLKLAIACDWLIIFWVSRLRLLQFLKCGINGSHDQDTIRSVFAVTFFKKSLFHDVPV